MTRVTMTWKTVKVKTASFVETRARRGSAFNASCSNLGLMLIVLFGM